VLLAVSQDSVETPASAVLSFWSCSVSEGNCGAHENEQVDPPFSTGCKESPESDKEPEKSRVVEEIFA
jgi:hypothetical protein